MRLIGRLFLLGLALSLAIPFGLLTLLIGIALEPAAREHFEGVRAGLADLGIPAAINPRLVRGMDYYNRTVFEWVTDKLGAQSTVCGGGSYDPLVEMLGGRPAPACGFAIWKPAPSDGWLIR